MLSFSSSNNSWLGGKKKTPTSKKLEGGRGWIFLLDFQLFGFSLRAELQELILSCHSHYLHVLNHDAVGKIMGIQEFFDSLEAGEGHPQVHGVAKAVGVTPKIHLGGRS